MKAQTTEQIQYTLFIDMDGVLCDFNKRVQEITGIKDNVSQDKYKIPNTDKMIWWDDIYAIGEKFWIDMEFLESGHKLWEIIKFYPYKEILTICGRNDFGHIGKIKWIENNLQTSIPINILTWGESKGTYANPHNILIDDYDKNINEWIENNGIAIKHKTFDATYNKLSKYINV